MVKACPGAKNALSEALASGEHFCIHGHGL